MTPHSSDDPQQRLPLRIGLFTHSTNPRGGVVHALELGESLCELGHTVVVHAPAELGQGFFRPTDRVRQALIPAGRVGDDLAALVRQRVSEIVEYLTPRGRSFDIFHAHDAMTGGALAELVARGTIPGFVRTVHHLNEFADPLLHELEARSLLAASQCLCVSKVWRERLAERFGIDATVVTNGVDLTRFTPEPNIADGDLRRRLMESAGRGPVFLAVGGVERRKNTLNALKAFLLVRRSLPRAVLLIAGGASLLEHSNYQQEFDEALAAAGPDVAGSVVVTGPLPDDQMPAAYRLADALVFPSVTEGFGLAVLEAMACGTPVVASRVPPFTEYLADKDALLVDPTDVTEIATAMCKAVEPDARARFREGGLAVTRRFPWSASAKMHDAVYRQALAKWTVGSAAHTVNAVPSAVGA